jgi:hypothetical protein
VRGCCGSFMPLLLSGASEELSGKQHPFSAFRLKIIGSVCSPRFHCSTSPPLTIMSGARKVEGRSPSPAGIFVLNRFLSSRILLVGKWRARAERTICGSPSGHPSPLYGPTEPTPPDPSCPMVKFLAAPVPCFCCQPFPEGSNLPIWHSPCPNALEPPYGRSRFVPQGSASRLWLAPLLATFAPKCNGGGVLSFHCHDLIIPDRPRMPTCPVKCSEQHPLGPRPPEA